MAGHIRTVPLEPLIEFMQPYNVCHFARMLDTDNIRFYQWKKNGIPIYKADLIAVKILGIHPGVIWPNHWFKEDN